MGGGVTDIAIVKENGIATGCSINISGAKMAEAIYEYIYRHYNVTISSARAEQLLCERSTLSERENGVTQISGKDVATGDYKKLEISSQDVRNAILPVVGALVDSIIAMSRICPENLVDSLKHGGLQLYGGLSGIHYLDTYLINQLNLAVEVHPDVSSVAVGASTFFDDRAKLYHMIGLRGDKQ
jgi:rod shape-determining protein MreB